jgi:hypothetical protein
MSGQTALKAVLLSFVALSVAVWTSQHWHSQWHTTPSAAGYASAPTDRLIVYCFHSTVRCPTCLHMESYAREALDDEFADAIRNRRIEFLAIDVERSENEHFRDDYQLVGPAVVLVRVRDGKTVKWDNLIEVARLLRNKSRCVEYIREQVRAAMEGSQR